MMDRYRKPNEIQYYKRRKTMTVDSKFLEEDILKILQDIGMTELEATVYTFIFRNGGATTRDILRSLNMRQPQLYDITSGLERKGFINTIEGRPKRYEVIKPEIIYQQREINLKRMKNLVLEWAKANEPMRYRNEPEIFISRNLNGFLSNTLDIINNAKEYILIHTTLKDLENYTDALNRKSKEGVRIMLMLFDGYVEYGNINELVSSDIFSDIRSVKVGKFFTVIADNLLSSLMPRKVLLDPEAQKYGYVFKDFDMTWFLIHNFFAGWFQGRVLLGHKPIIPYDYRYHRIAMSDMQELVNSGKKNITLQVKGSMRVSGLNVDISGSFNRLNIDNDIANIEMFDTSGKLLLIGGFDSNIEDVIAEEIKILSAS